MISHYVLLLAALCISVPVVASEEAVGIDSTCGANEKSQRLAQLVIDDADQQRSFLTCNKLLSEIAQKKAEEMAATGKVSHNGPGGWPDERLLSSGYNLYLPKGATSLNHVEAILGGYSSAEDVLDSFKNSFHHRVHLFAEHSFFLQQDDIGVGYAYSWESPHVDYWVVYIASDKAFDIQQRINSSRPKKDILIVTKPDS
jgi:hypothetical protein